jgi:NAD(P)-dependent dehydrogenase (short-subunit alcohol dehydrogenase family)
MKYYDPELWAQVMNANLNGPVLLTQAVLPMLEVSGETITELVVADVVSDGVRCITGCVPSLLG